MQDYKEWLFFASDDLYVAKTMLESPYVVIAAVCYHSQQAAEKSLKAYLSYKSQPIKKIHDLEELTQLCIILDVNFSTLLDDALELNRSSKVIQI